MVARRRADWMCQRELTSKHLETKRLIEMLSACINNLERMSEILLFILNKQ
jgi:hypothetical protein